MSSRMRGACALPLLGSTFNREKNDSCCHFAARSLYLIRTITDITILYYYFIITITSTMPLLLCMNSISNVDDSILSQNAGFKVFTQYNANANANANEQAVRGQLVIMIMITLIIPLNTNCKINKNTRNATSN